MSNKSVVDILSFPDGWCHILNLMPRKKDWVTEWQKRSKMSTHFPRTREEWLDKLDILQKMKTDWAVGRIYSTYNPRSLKKWALNMMEFFTNAVLADDYSFMARGKWLIESCLKKKGSRMCKDYYMVDCDCKNLVEIINIVDELWWTWYETPNGCHILAKPFDVKKFKEKFEWEVKSDEFIYIDW